MGWAVPVALTAEMKNTYNILVRKSDHLQDLGIVESPDHKELQAEFIRLKIGSSGSLL
jgi:hypothetical protein